MVSLRERTLMPTYDAAAVARLDRHYSTPQIVDQRVRFRAAVAARPGERGLDVGCGAGHLACGLAREVATGGRIDAVDRSRDSDWDMCAWDSKDPLVTRRMVAGR